MDSQALPPPAIDAAVRNNFSTEADRILTSIPKQRIPGLYWDLLSTGPIQRSKLTAAKAQAMSEGFLVTDESTMFTTADGEPIIYFLKDAFEVCFPKAITDDLHARVTSSIDHLTERYPPKALKNDDKRSPDDTKTILEQAKKEGKPVGVYHFFYWNAKGHSAYPGSSPSLSTDITKANPAQRELIDSFFINQAPLSQGIGMWFEKIDPSMFKEYHECHSNLANAGVLGPLRQSSHTAYLGMALLLNYSVSPHKDRGDVKLGWTATTLEGVWTGGHLVFPNYGIRINQKPGDVVFTRAALLLHYVSRIESGYRSCMTHSTKADILEPPPQNKIDKEFPCPSSLCDRGFSTNGSLSRHLRNVEKNHPSDNKHDFIQLRETHKW